MKNDFQFDSGYLLAIAIVMLAISSIFAMLALG